MRSINYIILAVGKRGCGKTTLAIEIAEKSGKNILVLNTDNNDAYKDFQVVPLQNLQKWKGKRGICITDNSIEAFTILNQYKKNLFIICDDTQKYVSQTVEREVRSFIINHRMNNFDVLFMYHSLKFVPPYLAMQYNMIALFKTNDIANSTLKDKYINFENIEKKMIAVKQHQSPYYCEIINDNDE